MTVCQIKCNNSSWNASCVDFQFRHFRGLLFIRFEERSNSCLEISAESVFFGKNYRSKPFAFSLRPLSTVAVLNAPAGNLSIKELMAFSIEPADRLGILIAMYQRVLRSINVAKHPLLLPRLDTIVSSSQWPNVSLVRISLGR